MKDCVQWKYLVRSGVVTETNDQILAAIWITMLYVQSEIRPLLRVYEQIFMKVSG